LDISTLADETITQSQDVRPESPSDMVPLTATIHVLPSLYHTLFFLHNLLFYLKMEEAGSSKTAFSNAGTQTKHR
jgi:hypothetical protein